MKILWLTWKDGRNPAAGGAELVNEELAKRLAKDGHKVIFLVAGFHGGEAEETINGYKIIRLGNKWTVYWKAYRYYKKNLVGWADAVIDEVNTIPFFAKYYVKERNIVLCYQLCREIWFYQMFFPLNLIGYLLEPIYMRLLNDRYVLTESESTKKDLQKFGFIKDRVFVFPIGIEAAPLAEKEFSIQKKSSDPVMLYFGSIRSMKRPEQALKAFEIAKKDIRNLKFWIAGSGQGKFAENFFKQISKSKYSKDIVYFGKVSQEKKLELMRDAHAIVVTSVKEGWGIIVTEANSQGTPAVVYDVDGLRDSVKNNETGSISQRERVGMRGALKNTSKNLAENIVKLMNDKEKYQELRQNAWKDSQKYNNQNSYEVFKNIIDNIIKWEKQH